MDKSGRYVLPEQIKGNRITDLPGFSKRITAQSDSLINIPINPIVNTSGLIMKRIFKMSRKSSANQFPLRIFSPQKRMSRKNIFGSCFYSQAMNEPTGQPISQTILRLPENGRNHPNHHHTRQNDNFLNPPNLIHISILIS